MASKRRKRAPKPVQGAGNMPLNDEQAARQVEFLKSKNKEKEVKGMKKMNMGWAAWQALLSLGLKNL